MVRPVSYVPYHLAASTMPLGSMAREVVNDSGAHLEQCVKRIRGAPKKQPLGPTLNIPRVRRQVGDELADAIDKYRNVWNIAKHEFEGGSPESVLSLADAIEAYFVSRALGFRVLETVKHGTVDKMHAALDEASQRGILYRRGYLLPQVGGKSSGTGRTDRMAEVADLPRPIVTVTPVEVMGTPDFGAWLQSVPYPTWVSVIAALERLAAFGRSLGDPEVLSLHAGTYPALHMLMPQPPAVGAQVVFGFDPLERVVLLEGGRRFESAKNLRRILRRYRSLRRWDRLLARGELAPLEQLAGSISNEGRVEIGAARDNAALHSLLFSEAAVREARRKIQLELDYLIHRPEPEDTVDSDGLSDNWLLQHNRARAEQIGYGDSVLTNLPTSEAIPLADVHRTNPRSNSRPTSRLAEAAPSPPPGYRGAT